MKLLDNRKLTEIGVIFSLLLIPSTVYANVILPSYMIATGLLEVWFLPLMIIFIEAIVIKILFRNSILVAVLQSAVMNVLSTVIGLLLMIVLDISLLFSVEYFDHILRSHDLLNIIFSISVAIFYFFGFFSLTIYTEYQIAKNILKISNKKLFNNILLVNTSTYLFLLIIIVIIFFVANVL